jgi:hypothetical protein
MRSPGFYPGLFLFYIPPRPPAGGHSPLAEGEKSAINSNSTKWKCIFSHAGGDVPLRRDKGVLSGNKPPRGERSHSDRGAFHPITKSYNISIQNNFIKILMKILADKFEL